MWNLIIIELKAYSIAFFLTIIIYYVVKHFKIKCFIRAKKEPSSKSIFYSPKAIISFMLSLFVIISIILLYNEGKQKIAVNTSKDKKIRFVVKLEDIALDHNNNVGNDWSFIGKINDIQISEGEEIEILATIDDKITLSCMAKENDSIPDVGNGQTVFNIKDLKTSEKNAFSIEIMVSENRGRYSGSTAQWNFNFSIERKETLADIIRNLSE